MTMRISFDLDETLIIADPTRPREEGRSKLRGTFIKEHLRRGIKDLAGQLIKEDWAICVYTTSERSERYIRRLFAAYGIKLEKVINAAVHARVVQSRFRDAMPSKVPSRFGIDLHVDDDLSVKQNGVHHGFNVCLLESTDLDWTNKVIDEARRIQRMKETPRPNT